MAKTAPGCTRLWLLVFICSVAVLLFTAVLFEHRAVEERERRNVVITLPKVALLYLSRGPMPTALVWKEFFLTASLLEPAKIDKLDVPIITEQNHLVPPYSRGTSYTTRPAGFHNTGKRLWQKLANKTLLEGTNASLFPLPSSSTTRRLFQATSAVNTRPVTCSDRLALDGSDVIAQQSLFSVYLHTPPNHTYCSEDLFANYVLPQRVMVHWGQHSMVEAERLLLAAALMDTLNQRFVFLSESCVPLYPPHVVWLQTTWERQSRINACKGMDDNNSNKRGADRWPESMLEYGVERDAWRKSSQWSSLIRKHAQLVADDNTVHSAFKELCYTFWEGREDAPEHLNSSELTPRNCISDEHYIPTLLAVRGMEEETDCLGALTHTEWRHESWSPKTYKALQVSYYLLRRLRRAWYTNTTCTYTQAIASANSMMRAKGGMLSIAAQRNLSVTRQGGASLSIVQPSEYVPLDHGCSLFARKFDVPSSEALMKLTKDCDYGLGFDPSCVNNAGPLQTEAAKREQFQSKLMVALHAITERRARHPRNE